MGERIEVHAERDVLGRGHSVYVVQGNSVMAPMMLVFDPAAKVEPTIGGTAGTEFLKAALNCAWAAGMRPDGFSDTTEQVKAIGRHLEDMRALTFAKLNVEKPNG